MKRLLLGCALVVALAGLAPGQEKNKPITVEEFLGANIAADLLDPGGKWSILELKDAIAALKKGNGKTEKIKISLTVQHIAILEDDEKFPKGCYLRGKVLVEPSTIDFRGRKLKVEIFSGGFRHSEFFLPLTDKAKLRKVAVGDKLNLIATVFRPPLVWNGTPFPWDPLGGPNLSKEKISLSFNPVPGSTTLGEK